MSCKSAIFTANTTAQTVAVGGTLSLGSIIRRYGCDLNLNAHRRRHSYGYAVPQWRGCPRRDCLRRRLHRWKPRGAAHRGPDPGVLLWG